MFLIRRSSYKSKLSYNGRGVPRSIDDLLSSHFSVVYWMRGSKPGSKPTRMVIDLYKDGLFYSGLTVLVKRYLRRMGYECKIKDKKKYYRPDSNCGARRIRKNFRYSLRDYQLVAVAKALPKPLSLTSLPTGSGKSLVMAALLLADNKKTLIVVDSKTLMRQLADDIELATGIECGQVGDGVFAPRKWTVAVIDSLLTGRGEELIRSVRAVYFDEAHKAGATSYRRVVDVGHANLWIRRGFSGTTYRNDHRTLLLPALTGPVTIHRSTSQLIEAGWLAIPHIMMPVVSNFRSKIKWYNKVYSTCIINNNIRNLMGVNMLVHFAKKGHLSVGLFRNVRDHLPLLRDAIYRRIDKSKVGIIYGNVPLHRRQRILEQFADGDKMILLASVGTIGEGTDLPGETKLGVNFVGGCSEVATRQWLGRVLRKPKLSSGEVQQDKPFKIRYIDPYDKTHEEMERQSQVRYDIYDSEPAFRVRKIVT